MSPQEYKDEMPCHSLSLPRQAGRGKYVKEKQKAKDTGESCT